MKERFLDNVLDGFYKDGYVEDDRLTSDKMHYIEFITTTNYIDKYLKQRDRLLEVGAGTGAYSLYSVNKGYQVDALELVQANVDVMKSKIKEGMNINAIQGNALDLSMYEDNTFDITLVLGPLYHLFKKDEEDNMIDEEYKMFVDYHLSICEREDLIGYSGHILSIIEK